VSVWPVDPKSIHLVEQLQPPVTIPKHLRTVPRHEVSILTICSRNAEAFGEKSVSLLPSGIVLWMILEYHRDVRRLSALLLCQAFFASEPKEGMRIGHSHVVFSFRSHSPPHPRTVKSAELGLRT
jgi:hypothetical protein